MHTSLRSVFLKRFLAVTFTVLLITQPLTASGNAFDASLPQNVLMGAEFSLPAYLRSLLEQEIDKGAGEDGANPNKDLVIIQKLLSGGRFSGHFINLDQEAGEPSYVVSFVATSAEYQTFLGQLDNVTELTYEGMTYKTDGTMTYLYADGKVWLAPETSLKNVIDVMKGKAPALSVDPAYAQMKNVLPNWDTSIFSLFMDMKDIMAAVKTFLPPDDPTNDIVSLAERFIGNLGMTVAKTNYGYEMKASISMDSVELAKEGLLLAPGGVFVPDMYKKFPNAPVLYYAESNNLKASIEQSKKVTALLGETESLFGLDTMLGDPAILFDELGVDIRPLLDVLDKKMAVSIQDTGDTLPALTLMADVSTNPIAAETFITTWNDAFELILKDTLQNVVRHSTIQIGTKTFHQYQVDITKIEGYDGPSFKPLKFIFGVTDDNIIMFTTDSRISEHLGQGLQNNADFMAAYKHPEKSVTEIAYIGLRNAWDMLDDLVQWGLENGSKTGNAPTLEDIQGFYQFYQYIYAGKGLFSEGNVEGPAVTGTITLLTDSTEHETFDAWQERMKGTDTDNDGLSDYDEFFVHLTVFNDADTDNDGVNDGEEIEKGSDPRNIQSKLSDIAPEVWYAPEVSNLYQRRVIKGYDDGTYRAGQQVTRAEFVCMVNRAFETDLENFTGIPVDQLTPQFGSAGFGSPFADVHDTDWFEPCVANALNRGFIVFGENFRPGDPINRAEAMTMLVKTNLVLQMEIGEPSAQALPFNDVPDDAWFKPYVQSAYENDLTKGRTSNSFAPTGTVTRAEAAVMIKRTLDFDFQTIEHPEDLPQSSALTPIFPVFIPGAAS